MARNHPKPAKAPPWPTVQQRTNALINSAKATRDHYQRQPKEFDWDDAVTRFKTMIDSIDEPQ